MKNFDMNRFFQTLKWIIMENRQKLMLWTAGSTLGIFLLELFFYYMTSPKGAENYQQTTMVVAGVCAFFIGLAIMISVAGLFSEFTTKQRRVSLLMLPASNLEKFLSAVIYASVVSVACILLAFIVGDTLRMLTLSLFFHQPMCSAAGSLFTQVFHVEVNGITMGYWQLFLMQVLSLVLLHSTFTLGGSLFRKWPFLITAVIQIVLAMVFGMFMMFLSRNFDFELPMNLIEHYGKWMFYAYLLFLAAVSALFYWLSYRIFTRMQVISRKWVNV